MEGEGIAVVHGDYHAGNVMFENGTVSGVLDWEFRLSDPALDLASTMNINLVFTRQIDPTVSPHVCEKFIDGVLEAYQANRPLNHERIKFFRVFDLFRVLALGVPAVGPEFLCKAASQ
ncbi:MAG: phosphotransferase [Cyanobacteriota bacterium]|nr:phosphotransferase [Cyanobacteriota bacterium]